MWYQLTPAADYLKAELFGRETAEQTQEFLTALETEFVRLRCSRVLISVRSSKAIFAVEKYGLRTYISRAAKAPLKIALLGDSDELRIAHEYVEALARQHGVNLRAFRDEASAVRWLEEPHTRVAG